MDRFLDWAIELPMYLVIVLACFFPMWLRRTWQRLERERMDKTKRLTCPDCGSQLLCLECDIER